MTTDNSGAGLTFFKVHGSRQGLDICRSVRNLRLEGEKEDVMDTIRVRSGLLFECTRESSLELCMTSFWCKHAQMGMQAELASLRIKL